MITQDDIEHMLHQAKITSLSGIVGFIAGQVLTPIQELQNRIYQLERPRGMDRVMIEEVKTMIEAMIDQREDSLKRQLQKKYRDTVTNSFDVADYSRRSLHQIDIANLMNTQSGIHSQQLRKTQEAPGVQLPIVKPTPILGQIRELRQELLTVPSGRDLAQLKTAMNAISKDMISKMTYAEVESLVLRFQKQVFMKIGESRTQMAELESRLSCTMEECKTALTNQMSHSSMGKQDKKIRKCVEAVRQTGHSVQVLEEKVKAIECQLQGMKESMVESMGQLQGMFENLNVEKECELLKQSRQGRQEVGMWVAAPLTFKNGCVAWQKSISSENQGSYRYERNKTSIQISKEGLYQLQCWVFGGSGNLIKPPCLQIEGKPVGWLECQQGSDLTCRWNWSGIVRIVQTHTCISVRFEGEQNSSGIVLRAERLSDDIE